MEDLWAFNDPQVVRAVAASATPVISGIGHETDFTLSDFAADLRAPTPTAAAELATQITMSELGEQVRAGGLELVNLMRELLGQTREQLATAVNELRYQSPGRRIESDRQRLDELGRRVQAAETHRLALQISELQGWRKRLLALSPLEILNRGYAMVMRLSDGVVIRKVQQARGGIRVRVSDGGFDAEVVERGRGKP